MADPYDTDRPDPDVAADDDAAAVAPDGDDNSDASSNGDAPVPLDVAGDDDELRRLLAVNFLEYASYVIKDRAIPDVDDGLKPVQRRILHTLHVIDDGRFHKVANVIGQCMQYHPHGDASIGSALVVLANKEYFIERQGNFGNIFTGDPASAARYIECRLTPLAKEVLFNREITEMADSYDGRNQEPVVLPAKVPALLMLGAEGIAVGMTTSVLPHNFGELLQAQIAVLRNRPFRVYPDFQQGATMDVSDYDDGRGRVILRARIEADSDKRLLIREIPAGTTTESLIASIEEAARRNKVKIAAINDYTAETVEIEVLLPRGAYADETIKLLYAYTQCETSINSNITVIKAGKPVELTVSEILRHNTERLVFYLRRELEIELGKLHERYHEKTLAELFIEHRIYKRIEEAETMGNVMAEVRDGLAPFRERLERDVTDEDIEKLLQIQIRRISRFDINRNREELNKIAEGIQETRHRLRHLTDYAVSTLEGLIERYAHQYPRRTRIDNIEQVDARAVALRNIKVGHDRQNQFVGSDIRNSNRNESPLLCNEFDRLVLLGSDGSFKVVPVPQKLYVGPVKYVLRADREQVYSVIYRQRKGSAFFIKRFRIDSYIMEKEYQALPKGCLIEALYTNRGVVVRFDLVPNPRRKAEDSVVIDFESVELRAARARGFKVTNYPVQNVAVINRGTSAAPDEATPDAETESAAEAEAVPAAAAAAPDATPTGNETAAAATPAMAGPDSGSPEAPDGEPAEAAPEQPATREGKPPAAALQPPEGAAPDAERPPKTRRPTRSGRDGDKDPARRRIDEETPFFLE